MLHRPDAVTVNGVPGGSGNYTQNTTAPQTNSNFNYKIMEDSL